MEPVNTTNMLRRSLLIIILCARISDWASYAQDSAAEHLFTKPAFTTTRRCLLPKHADLVNDEVVKWAFKSAIYETVVKPDSSSHMVEVGGWIYQCRRKTSDGKFEYYLDAMIDRGTYRTRSSVTLDDATFYPHAPGNSECRTVGNFHTHPDIAARYANPVGGDVRGAERRGLPAFIVKNETKHREAKTSFPRFTPHGYGGWNQTGIANLSWRCPETTASATIEVDSRDFGSFTMELWADKKGGRESPRFELMQWPGQPKLAFHILDPEGEGTLSITAPARVGTWSGTQQVGDALVQVSPKGIMLSNMGRVFPYRLQITEYEPGKKIAGSFSGEMRGHSAEMGNSRVSGTFFLGPPEEHPLTVSSPEAESDTPVG
jgi:hypothetical protein